MEQKERGVRPICQPEEDIVPAREEEDQRTHDVREVSGPVEDESDDFPPSGCVPCIGLPGLVVDRSENNVENEKHENIYGLTNGRSIAEQIG